MKSIHELIRREERWILLCAGMVGLCVFVYLFTGWFSPVIESKF